MSKNFHCQHGSERLGEGILLLEGLVLDASLENGEIWYCPVTPPAGELQRNVRALLERELKNMENLLRWANEGAIAETADEIARLQLGMRVWHILPCQLDSAGDWQRLIPRFVEELTRSAAVKPVLEYTLKPEFAG